MEDHKNHSSMKRMTDPEVYRMWERNDHGSAPSTRGEKPKKMEPKKEKESGKQTGRPVKPDIQA